MLRVQHEMAWAIADRGDLERGRGPVPGCLPDPAAGAGGPGTKTSSTAATSSPGSPRAGQDWGTAEKGYRETLEDSVRIRNPEDPRIMLTLHELAWVIANQGRNRLGEALEIFRAVLATGAGYSAPSTRGP